MPSSSTSSPKADLRWSFVSPAPYQATWDGQEAVRERVLAGDAGAEHVFFVEHPPVVTLGRSARPDNVLVPPAGLAARGVEVVRTSRGGDVTVHGPGQLVIYPVLRLRRGVVAHLEAVAGAIIDVVEALGVRGATWRRDPAGVWIEDRKLAACGIHVRRGVAVHGFALNVGERTRSLFDLIVPCGIAGARVTTIEAELGDRSAAPSLDALSASIAAQLATRLDRVAKRRIVPFDLAIEV